MCMHEMCVFLQLSLGDATQMQGCQVSETKSAQLLFKTSPNRGGGGEIGLTLGLKTIYGNGLKVAKFHCKTTDLATVPRCYTQIFKMKVYLSLLVQSQCSSVHLPKQKLQ